LPLSGLAGNNPASCREKNTPTPELYKEKYMLPFSFEWIWDMSHLIFHGGLWYALSVIGMGVTFCIIKAAYDTYKGQGSQPH